jgi:hypothetical protein
MNRSWCENEPRKKASSESDRLLRSLPQQRGGLALPADLVVVRRACAIANARLGDC